MFLVIFVLGFVLDQKASTEPSGLGDLDRVESAIHFMIACTALIALLVWLSYTAFGLSWFPLSFFGKPGQGKIAEFEDLERDIVIARDERRRIKSKKLAGRTAKQRDSEEQVGLLQRKV